MKAAMLLVALLCTTLTMVHGKEEESERCLGLVVKPASRGISSLCAVVFSKKDNGCSAVPQQRYRPMDVNAKEMKEQCVVEGTEEDEDVVCYCNSPKCNAKSDTIGKKLGKYIGKLKNKGDKNRWLARCEAALEQVVGKPKTTRRPHGKTTKGETGLQVSSPRPQDTGRTESGNSKEMGSNGQSPQKSSKCLGDKYYMPGSIRKADGQEHSSCAYVFSEDKDGKCLARRQERVFPESVNLRRNIWNKCKKHDGREGFACYCKERCPTGKALELLKEYLKQEMNLPTWKSSCDEALRQLQGSPPKAKTGEMSTTAKATSAPDSSLEPDISPEATVPPHSYSGNEQGPGETTVATTPSDSGSTAKEVEEEDSTPENQAAPDTTRAQGLPTEGASPVETTTTVPPDDGPKSDETNTDKKSTTTEPAGPGPATVAPETVDDNFEQPTSSTDDGTTPKEAESEDSTSENQAAPDATPAQGVSAEGDSPMEATTDATHSDSGTTSDETNTDEKSTTADPKAPVTSADADEVVTDGHDLPETATDDGMYPDDEFPAIDATTSTTTTSTSTTTPSDSTTTTNEEPEPSSTSSTASPDMGEVEGSGSDTGSTGSEETTESTTGANGSADSLNGLSNGEGEKQTDNIKKSKGPPPWLIVLIVFILILGVVLIIGGFVLNSEKKEKDDEDVESAEKAAPPAPTPPVPPAPVVTPAEQPKGLKGPAVFPRTANPPIVQSLLREQIMKEQREKQLKQNSTVNVAPAPQPSPVVLPAAAIQEEIKTMVPPVSTVQLVNELPEVPTQDESKREEVAPKVDEVKVDRSWKGEMETQKTINTLDTQPSVSLRKSPSKEDKKM